MRPHFGKAVLGGFVGTLGITVMMYWAGPLMGIGKMDIAQSLGAMLGIGWAGGMLLHFLNGTVIFPTIYVLLLYRRLPGTPVVKGLAWGAILWLLAQLVVMPMMGGGLFSANMGGAMAAMGSLVGHLVYGALLGAISGWAPLPAPTTHAAVSA
jgi:uncharacterized membrane protein YagU involved in acid resistance